MQKALVTAGGKETRLHCLKGRLNKHTLPVGGRPMIHHAMRTLAEAGIDQVMVTLNGEFPDTVMALLEDGSQFGLSICYSYVEAVDGPGRQLRVAEKWANGEGIVVMLGDGLFLTPLDLRAVEVPHMWLMPLSGFDDHRKYVQAQVIGNKITKLVRKPETQFSDLVQATVWAYPPDIFEVVAKVCETANGEVHMGTFAEGYVEKGVMTYTRLPPCSYLDLGTPEALEKANQLLRARR